MVTVPALPILIPLGLVLMVVSWVAIGRRGALTPWRLGAAWVAGWYAVAVVGATFLPLELSWGPAEAELVYPHLGGPQTHRIILVPLFTMRPTDFVLNIVMLLPLALLLRLVFGIEDRHRVVRAGILTSLAIETIQAVLVLTVHGNRWADINDLTSNTLGTVAGFLVLRRLLRVPAVQRLIDRATVPAGPPVLV
nr:VanZ family protein [uncultured Actinoplanes sp.]